MSGVHITLQRTIKVTSTRTQTLEFAVDCGAFRFVSARLRVFAVTGSGTAGIKIRHAAVLAEDEFKDLLTFSPTGVSVDFLSSADFSRYLIWQVSDMASFSEISFSIELVLKD